MKSPAKLLVRPDFSREDPNLGIVAGIDEAGRGPLAGPVVAASLYVPPENRQHPVWKEVHDSKKLTPIKREILFPIICSQAVFGIGLARADEIDELNILQATFLAMRRAIEHMNLIPHIVLIDGNRLPPHLPCHGQTLVRGDSLSVSIAAASILAKVTRDRLMTELHTDFPAYGWDRNAGYGTPEHLTALEAYGPCPHHRKSFAPICDMKLPYKAA
jgi:ribonuclease HII